MENERLTLNFELRSLIDDPVLTWSMKMEKTNFEKLQVYRLAESLADGIWAIVLGWDYFAKDTVGKQIVRAADSIGANIAEGTGRGTLQDNRRFIRMARGSYIRNETLAAPRLQKNSLNREANQCTKTYH